MKNEELIKARAGEMLVKLLADVVSQKAVEIRFEFEDNEQWSVTGVHDENDEEISLRLHSGERYELYLGYYNEDDEFLEIIQPLTEEEKQMIPKGLNKVMAKVLSDEEGMRLPGTLLSK